MLTSSQMRTSAVRSHSVTKLFDKAPLTTRFDLNSAVPRPWKECTVAAHVSRSSYTDPAIPLEQTMATLLPSFVNRLLFVSMEEVRVTLCRRKVWVYRSTAVLGLDSWGWDLNKEILPGSRRSPLDRRPKLPPLSYYMVVWGGVGGGVGKFVKYGGMSNDLSSDKKSHKVRFEQALFKQIGPQLLYGLPVIRLFVGETAEEIGNDYNLLQQLWLDAGENRGSHSLCTISVNVNCRDECVRDCEKPLHGSSDLSRSQEAERILLCETVNSCWQWIQSKEHVRTHIRTHITG